MLVLLSLAHFREREREKKKCVRECVIRDTELLLILEGEVEFDEERVIQVGHHIPLSLHVLRLVLLHDVALLQDLNCTQKEHYHTRLHVHSLGLMLPKGANTYKLTSTLSSLLD